MKNPVVSPLVPFMEQNNSDVNFVQHNYQELDNPLIKSHDMNELMNGNVLLDPGVLYGTTNDYIEHQQQQLDYGSLLIDTMPPYHDVPLPPEILLPAGINNNSISSLMPRPAPRDRLVELDNYLQFPEPPPPISTDMTRNKSHQMLDTPGHDDRTKMYGRQQSTPSNNNIKLGVSEDDPSRMISKKRNVSQLATKRHQQFNYLQVPMRRSQKLSDKIAVLHQLVCPYGKTDTASVLNEACNYINKAHQDIQSKVLQVVLNLVIFQRLENGYFDTTTLLNNYKSPGMNLQQQPADLRCRGLCLVPASITKKITKEERLRSDYHVASSTN